MARLLPEKVLLTTVLFAGNERSAELEMAPSPLLPEKVLLVTVSGRPGR